MGSDIFWHGKQDDHSLRKTMARELSSLCEDLNLEYEIASSDVIYEASIPFTFYEEKRNEELKKSEWWILKKRIYTVWREGVIVYPFGKNSSFVRELSFAFTNGPDLPWEIRHSIASLPDNDRDSDNGSRFQELRIGGYWRDSSSTSYALSTLLVLIKRLWVPSLSFASDYDEHINAQSWAEESKIFLWSDYQVLDFFRGSFFRKHFQEFCGFGTGKINMGCYPDFWERYKLFSDGCSKVKCPDIAALCRMMDQKFNIDWRAASVAALLFKPISSGDFLKFNKITHLGDLCNMASGLSGRANGKEKITIEQLINSKDMEDICRSFWFIADQESGFSQKELVDFIDPIYSKKSSIVADDGTKNENMNEIENTHISFNSHLVYQFLLASILNKLRQAQPDNLVALYEHLWKLPLFPDVIKYSVWPDGLAVLTEEHGLCFFPIWELCSCLPVFQQCFDEKPLAVSEILIDLLDSCEEELRLFAETYRQGDNVLPVPDFARASLLKEFFLYPYSTKLQVTTVEEAKNWMDRIQGWKSKPQWHYGEGFFVRKGAIGNGALLEAFSLKLVSAFVYFLAGDRLQIQGITGSYLSIRIEDDQLLNHFGIHNIGELCQFSGSKVKEKICAAGLSSDKKKRLIKIVSEYLKINEDNLDSYSGVDIQDKFFMPGVTQSIWPLVNRKVSRGAVCFDCDYNQAVGEKGSGWRFCSVRKIVIENELEELCYNYWRDHRDGSFPMHILGPLFRLTPRGIYGFMEKSETRAGE